MEKSKAAQISQVKDDLKATLVCPQCSFSKILDVRQFTQGQHKLKITCRCGNTFHAQLEFRKFIRKETDLYGTYKTSPPSKEGGNIVVVNLSLGGACFEVRGKHDLKIGQKGCIVFTLDNKKQTILVKDVVIRSVRDKKIGCEFLHDKAYEKDLGFYLFR